MGSGDNSGLRVACSGARRAVFSYRQAHSVGTAPFSRPVLPGSPGPAACTTPDTWGATPDLRHLPCRPPKREVPHPLESPSVPELWMKRMWKNVHSNIPKNSTFIILWQGSEHPQSADQPGGQGTWGVSGGQEIQFCTTQPKSLADSSDNEHGP